VHLVGFICVILQGCKVKKQKKTLPVIYKKTPFDLQPEDGFIKKPKHVVNMIL
jgi:hypothetical protein